MPDIRIEIKGLDRFNRALARIAWLFPETTAKMVYEIGTNIIKESKLLCPVASGTLRASGFCTLPAKAGGDPVASVYIGHGGYARDYAALVHETHSRQSKFLQIAFNREEATSARTVVDLIKALLKGRSTPFEKDPTVATNPWAGGNLKKQKGKGGGSE